MRIISADGIEREQRMYRAVITFMYMGSMRSLGFGLWGFYFLVQISRSS